VTVALGPLLAAVALLLGAYLARSAPDARHARATATRAAAVALSLAATRWPGTTIIGRRGPSTHPSLTITFAPTGWTAWLPVATALAGLLAVGLASVREHPPRTTARILLVLAAGVATSASSRPEAVSVLWALSAAPLWLEVRDRLGGRGPARLFALHQLLGIGLATAGATLRAAGGTTATAVGGGLLAGAVVVRLGLFPAHLWATRVLESTPVGLAVAFLAVPSGPALLLSHPSELARPPLDGDLAGLVAAAGALTAVLGALLGLVQAEARRALAMLAVALSGMAAAGLATASRSAVSGAVLTWEVYAVAAGGAMMVIGATEARRGPMTLTGPGGSFSRTPRLAVAFLFFGLTAAGFPLTLGYLGNDLLIDGVREASSALMIALAVAGTASGAIVVRWFIIGFTGRRDHDGEPDATRRELAAVTAALAALVIAGLAPALTLPYPM